MAPPEKRLRKRLMPGRSAFDAGDRAKRPPVRGQSRASSTIKPAAETIAPTRNEAGS